MKKFKIKINTLLACIIALILGCMVFGLFSINNSKTKNADMLKADSQGRLVSNQLQIGDYVDKLGKFSNKDLLWRVVDKDDNGIMLQLDKVLSDTSGNAVLYKYSDPQNKPSNASNGFINATVDKTFGQVYTRNDKGTNYWEQSNIRSFLNNDFFNSFDEVEKSSIVLKPNVKQVLHWSDVSQEFVEMKAYFAKTPTYYYAELTDFISANDFSKIPTVSDSTDYNYYYGNGDISNANDAFSKTSYYMSTDSVFIAPQTVTKKVWDSDARNTNGSKASYGLDNNNNIVGTWTSYPSANIDYTVRQNSAVDVLTWYKNNSANNWSYGVEAQYANSENAVRPSIYLKDNIEISLLSDAQARPDEQKPYKVYSLATKKSYGNSDIANTIDDTINRQHASVLSKLRAIQTPPNALPTGITAQGGQRAKDIASGLPSDYRFVNNEFLFDTEGDMTVPVFYNTDPASLADYETNIIVAVTKQAAQNPSKPPSPSTATGKKYASLEMDMNSNWRVKYDFTQGSSNSPNFLFNALGTIDIVFLYNADPLRYQDKEETIKVNIGKGIQPNPQETIKIEIKRTYKEIKESLPNFYTLSNIYDENAIAFDKLGTSNNGQAYFLTMIYNTNPNIYNNWTGSVAVEVVLRKAVIPENGITYETVVDIPKENEQAVGNVWAKGIVPGTVASAVKLKEGFTWVNPEQKFDGKSGDTIQGVVVKYNLDPELYEYSQGTIAIKLYDPSIGDRVGDLFKNPWFYLGTAFGIGLIAVGAVYLIIHKGNKKKKHQKAAVAKAAKANLNRNASQVYGQRQLNQLPRTRDDTSNLLPPSVKDRYNKK